MGKVAKVALAATAVFCSAVSAAGAVTPRWECVPSAAGQPVTSGGIGASPSCSSGKAVLAPTYISSGVGGKPTVAFSGVNVQIVSGSGSTSGPVNGEGNLIIGYAENANNFSQAGSHDLVVGKNNGWDSFGEIVGGEQNQALGKYATAVGDANRASGVASFAAGESNLARGLESSVLGGDFNLARAKFSSVVGGCENLAGSGSPLSGSCLTGAEAVLGGFENTASGLESTISGGEVNFVSGGSASIAGGQFNNASGGGASVAGGNGNIASGSFASILGGFENTATTFEASVSGGDSNTASARAASVLGGHGNNASSNCEAIPSAPGSC
jgi:trimeric autotransporter adhesin